MSQSVSFGIVIPTYNEGQTIKDLIRALSPLPGLKKIVVVDDSPKLDTIEAVHSLELKNVETIHRVGKMGRGSAVIEGLRNLVKSPEIDYFLEMDADFSHNPDEIHALLEKASQGGYGLVLASRYLPTSQIKNWPITRRLFSLGANLLARMVLGVGVTDYTNGFRCYSRSAATLIATQSGRLGKGFIALSETLVRLRLAELPIGELPSIFVNRMRGESSVTYKEIGASIIGLFRIASYYHFTHFFDKD